MKMYIPIKPEDYDLLDELETAHLIQWSYQSTLVNVMIREGDIQINKELFGKYTDEYVEAYATMALKRKYFEKKYIPIRYLGLSAIPNEISFIKKAVILDVPDNSSFIEDLGSCGYAIL